MIEKIESFSLISKWKIKRLLQYFIFYLSSLFLPEKNYIHDDLTMMEYMKLGEMNMRPLDIERKLVNVKNIKRNL